VALIVREVMLARNLEAIERNRPTSRGVDARRR
jgi:hypothetical protein